MAELLCKSAGYPDYKLFLCNSGAEANENAMKVASFKTGRDSVLVMRSAFHGRTSQAVAATDNPKIQAPINKTQKVTFIPMNNVELLEEELKKEIYAAVMIEGITFLPKYIGGFCTFLLYVAFYLLLFAGIKYFADRNER